MMESERQQIAKPDGQAASHGNRDLSPVAKRSAAESDSPWGLRAGMLLTIALAALHSSGCNNNPSSEGEKLSHQQSSYWPDDLMDAADKLEHRLAVVEREDSQNSVFIEIVQIISWLPEIAADTDMPEREWEAIYDQSESLRKRLSGRANPIESKAEIFALVQLIRSSGSIWSNRSPQPSTASLHGYPGEDSE